MIPSLRQVALLRKMDVDALMRAAPRANMIMRGLGKADARRATLDGAHKARCEIGKPWFTDAELAESLAHLEAAGMADRRIT